MALLSACLTAAGACGIAGSWRTVAVGPADQGFPIRDITFDREGRFTATSDGAHGSQTRTGAYAWNGTTLRLATADGAQRTYAGRRRMDGRLVLVDQSEGRTLRAILERSDADIPHP